MILAYDCSRQEKPLKYLKLKDVKDEEEALYEIGRFLEVNKLNEHYSLTYVDRRQEGIVTFAYGGMEMYDAFKRRLIDYYSRNNKLDLCIHVEITDISDYISISHNSLIPFFFLLIKDEFAFEDKYRDGYLCHPLISKQKQEIKEKDVRCLNSEHKPYGAYKRERYSEYFFRCPLRFSKSDKLVPLAELGCGLYKVWWYDEVELYYKDVFKREVGEIKCHSS